MRMSVGKLKVGEASVDALKLRSSPRSSPESSPGSFPEYENIRCPLRWKQTAPSSERFLPILNSGRSLVSSALRLVGFSTLLSVAGASPASAPGPSSSQMSSTFPTVWYWGVRATIVAAAIGVIGLCITIYMCFCLRERGDSVRGVLHVLTRPFGEGARAMRMSVGRLKVGEASVDALKLRSSPGSSPESSPESSPGSFPGSSRV